ncbi:S-adenosyl-L-methionine-dependent methyltransferase [Violaceomyces palustris]|uniref:S-adenosyl-L-methionine-dependent methyltransferase n=1 Tax=Violaceomyces palustris TaxID=1673888 RepID=A0ACD0NUV1_9BASI|nr:S-adenosyl-L-methionine-dependent methyltransferase [Violaceomyces palustris]
MSQPPLRNPFSSSPPRTSFNPSSSNSFSSVSKPAPKAGLSLGPPRSKRTPSQKSGSKDDAIRSTDSDALISRLSALEAGYLDQRLDPFTRLFLSSPFPTTSGNAPRSLDSNRGPPPSQRRPPLINIGTFLRCSTLDKMISDFLLSDQLGVGKRRSKKQILSIGSGSDSRFWRIKSDPRLEERLGHYLELDFPQLTRKKIQSIIRSEMLSSLVEGKDSIGSDQGGGAMSDRVRIENDETRLLSPNYSLHPFDIRESKVEGGPPDFLEQLDPDSPTLILAECVLAYIRPTEANRFLGLVTSHFKDVTLLGYDICLGGDQGSSDEDGSELDPNREGGGGLGEEGGRISRFGKVMLANLESRNLNLEGAKQYTEPRSHLKRFQTILLQPSSSSSSSTHDHLVGKEEEKVDAETRPQAIGDVDVRGGFKSLKRIWDDLDSKEKDRLSRLEGLDEVEEMDMLLSHYCLSWCSRKTK